MTLHRGMESQSTLVEFDRPGRLTVASTTDRRDIDTTYTFASANGRVRQLIGTISLKA